MQDVCSSQERQTGMGVVYLVYTFFLQGKQARNDLPHDSPSPCFYFQAWCILFLYWATIMQFVYFIFSVLFLFSNQKNLSFSTS